MVFLIGLALGIAVGIGGTVWLYFGFREDVDYWYEDSERWMERYFAAKQGGNREATDQ